MCPKFLFVFPYMCVIWGYWSWELSSVNCLYFVLARFCIFVILASGRITHKMALCSWPQQCFGFVCVCVYNSRVLRLYVCMHAFGVRKYSWCSWTQSTLFDKSYPWGLGRTSWSSPTLLFWSLSMFPRIAISATGDASGCPTQGHDSDYSADKLVWLPATLKNTTLLCVYVYICVRCFMCFERGVGVSRLALPNLLLFL